MLGCERLTLVNIATRPMREQRSAERANSAYSGEHETRISWTLGSEGLAYSASNGCLHCEQTYD